MFSHPAKANECSDLEASYSATPTTLFSLSQEFAATGNEDCAQLYVLIGQIRALVDLTVFPPESEEDSAIALQLYDLLRTQIVGNDSSEDYIELDSLDDLAVRVAEWRPPGQDDFGRLWAVRSGIASTLYSRLYFRAGGSRLVGENSDDDSFRKLIGLLESWEPVDLPGYEPEWKYQSAPSYEAYGAEVQRSKAFRIRQLVKYRSQIVSTTTSAQSDEDKIFTRETGEDSFEVTLESTSVFDLSSATDRIAPATRELCGERDAELGRYTFDMDESVTGSNSEGWFRLVQVVRCVDSVAEPPAAERVPQLGNEAAVEKVRSTVRELSKEYFENLYAFMGDDARAALAAMGGAGDPDASTRAATMPGTHIEIDLYRLTVYDNLPNAPADGVYVAVDYDNRVGNVAHHCGYLMWHSFDVERFTLGRVESGVLSDDLVGSMSDDEVSAVMKRLRCSNFYDE